MKTRADVTAAKLRGGFYSPAPLVARCLDRVAALVEGRAGLRVLEPSAGDGAFARGLAVHALHAQVAELVAVELLPEEAARCRTALAEAGLPGRVLEGSVLPWLAGEPPCFDVAVGNPPFVRYQFVAPEDKALVAALGARLGLRVNGVSNLWIPVLLAALGALAPGGAFAFIVPAEVFTGISAGVARRWLADHVADLRADLFPAGSFPGVLQEVVILSGRRRAAPGPAMLTVCEHLAGGGSRAWRATPAPAGGGWMSALLAPAQLAALEEAQALPAVRPLGEVARFEVAIVTGANEYFSVDAATIARHGLAPWAAPLLPRIRHAPGLVHTAADQAALVAAGAPGALLHFAADRPDPLADPRVAAYLAEGERQGLSARFKCAIREPWYRVPGVRAGRFMLSKRSHRFPRLVLNEAGVLTTDTIYRGALRPGTAIAERDVPAAFHNSLTALSAELEGRSFGGGVLELVPSEVARLALPLAPGLGARLTELDARLRTAGEEAMREETDRLLAAAGLGLSADLLARLREAHGELQRRRLARN